MIETQIAVLALVIVSLPFLIVGSGYVYGKLTGAGADMDSLDDAVSKGLEARRDTEPEETNE